MQPLPPSVCRGVERRPSVSSTGKSAMANPKVNFREDVGLYVDDLIVIETKELNKILKKNNIPKARQIQIKKERRTLKNRG